MHCWSEPAGRVNTPPRGGRSFDSLERRELLSYTVVVDGDQLQIVGTDGRECLYVTQQRDHVEIREFCRGERKTRETIPGVFASLDVDLLAGDDKLILKQFTGSDIDVVLGDGHDTVRYYDTLADEFCVEAGDGDDVVKARRNRGANYMLDGGAGQDSLTNWANNRWEISDITNVERQGVFRNGRVHD